MNNLLDSKVVLSISEIETIVSDKEKLSKLVYYEDNIHLFNSNYSLNDYISNIDSYIYAHLRLPIEFEERNRIIEIILNFINVVLTSLIKKDSLYFYKINFVLLLLKSDSSIDDEIKKQIDSFNISEILIKLYKQSLKDQEIAIKKYYLKHKSNIIISLFYLKEYLKIAENVRLIYDVYENCDKHLKKLMIDDNTLGILFNS